MSLIDLKLTETDFQQRKISDLSDTPNSDGMTAAMLKAYFDYMPKTMIAMGAINGIIDLLLSYHGAENIGGNVSGIAGTTIQEILVSIKGLLDSRYTKDNVNELLKDKADNTTVQGMIKSVEFNPETGVFAFTELGGQKHSFDTALEKVAINFGFDEEKQAITLQLADGNEQKIPLASFITVNEIVSSDHIQVNVENGVITLKIKNGVITDEMLASGLLATIRECAAAAQNAADSAAASNGNAKIYAEDAQKAAEQAQKAASEAAAEAENAKANRASAEAAAAAAGLSATNASEAEAKTLEYKTASENAVEAAAGHANNASASADASAKSEALAKAYDSSCGNHYERTAALRANVLALHDETLAAATEVENTKANIVEEVLAALPAWEGGEY